MAVFSKLASAAALVLPLAGLVLADSLADIEHVVLFMQENRAFDHYFGTMAGVRGFADPNVQVDGSTPVWTQTVNSTTTLNPWYINYLGGSWLNATQCMAGGSNGWGANQQALAHGSNNAWAVRNTPYSWGHFRRDDIPTQFAIADGWTIGDMYQEAVIAATNPNRVTWVSGSINVPGSPQDESEGGYPYIDNNETPGCDSEGVSCYPLRWKTAGEIYGSQNVTWQIYQDADNFDDNPYAWFAQVQDAATGSDLYERGMAGQSLATFYAQAANGTLPAVSYIIGPSELSEHPQYTPRDGAWLQRQIVDAVTQSPAYNRTALIVSYDETGGWGDHVVPFHSPNGTAGEYLEDPLGSNQGYVYSGPGFRVPLYIVSPWTRGGHVFSEHADHNSQILFVEKWQAARGKNVTTPEMGPWRRAHMSDLTAAFDFAAPDYSLPELPYAIPPHKTTAGAYDGAAHCEASYPTQRPPVPYSGVAGAVALADVPALAEEGYKAVRGRLTEGRYLVFESGSSALTNPSAATRVAASAATASHDSVSQRWVVHVLALGTDRFQINSALDGRWLTGSGTLTSDAASAGNFTVSFAAGQGYGLQNGCGRWLTAADNGSQVFFGSDVAYWKTYSVTYHDL